MAKNKFYVVWKGLNPGIYDNWAECKAQVDGQEGAKYKSRHRRRRADLPVRLIGGKLWIFYRISPC